MRAGVSQGAAAAGGAAGTLTAAAIPLPIVSDVAGWAVEESIQWLVNQIQNIAEYPKHCRELLVLLRDPRLHKAVHALDQLTDLPEFAEHRPDYDNLCGALEEAEVVLLQGSGERHRESFFSKAKRKLRHQVMHSGKPKSVIAKLRPFCELQKYVELFNTLHNMTPPQPTRVQRVGSLPPLNPACGPMKCIPKYSEPALPKPIFKHGDHLVPRIDILLTTTRNIGIVGMGGIGKTTIARAVFERAKSRFDISVWLTVGADAIIKQLLETAFTKLYPGHAPLETAAENLSYLAQRLHDQKRSVLLVLDDVWLSNKHAVLAALNFATRSSPGMQVAGSRLIVTTRDRTTLSYDPGSEADMHELEVVSPALLDEASAQQLFHHHAFGAADATPPQFVDPDTCLQLIRRCRGNPLALKVRGSEMRHCTTAAEWDRRSALQREKQDSGKDVATTTCASSVDALPPSLKECFMDFALFPEDAEVEQVHLLHLLATHAPLYSAASLRAAAAKLNQLVSRSLVSERDIGTDTEPRNVYYMHDILRSIAVQLSRKPESARSFCGSRSGPPDSVRYFSLYSGTVEQAEDERGSSICKHVRACIMAGVPLLTCGRLSCLPRMQYLWLQNPINVFTKQDLRTHMSPQMPMLRFVSLRCAASWLLEHLMTGRQLVHVDLSGCEFLKQLPEGLSGCSQLSHLHLHWCRGLVELPEGISGCSQLAHLDLRFCLGLKQLPEGISGCSQLTHLDLTGCAGLKELPEGISGCSQLAHLNLSRCAGLKELPEGISSCSQLAHLNLSRCEGLRKLPEGISSCSRLTYLDLTECAGLKELPEGISGCSRLPRLDLRQCVGLKELPEGISGCRQLTHPDLRGCAGLEKLPEGISACSRLALLHLGWCVGLEKLPEGISGRVFSQTKATSSSLPKSSSRSSLIE